MGKYSADVTETFVTLNDITFMVRSFDWNNKDGSHSFNHDVYQPIEDYSDGFGTVTTYNEQLWGKVNTHFDNSAFEQYAPYTDERSKQVYAYHDFRNAVAEAIIEIALS